MNKRIILKSDEAVTCPDCGQRFPLETGITRQTIERYESEYEAAIASERKTLQEQLEGNAHKRAKTIYQSQLSELQEQLKESRCAVKNTQQKLIEAKQQGATEARAEAEAEAAILRQELDIKAEKLTDYHKQELRLRQEKKELEEARHEMELGVQRRLDDEKRLVEQRLSSSFGLREAEYKKKINDAQKANDDLRRKLEQGSQQLQGEVLELELEELLRTSFPLDDINPVRKGLRGADIIQTVRTRGGTMCGRIIWETKRAEHWSNSWVPKLKDDQHAASAEIAILVSSVFPYENAEPFLQSDSVWLVRPLAIRAVAEVLRASLIEIQKQKIASAGKNEIAEALYDYMCSARFSQKVRSVVDAYRTMHEDLGREKAAMTKLWKKREMQLERLTSNMMGLCGELQGISKNALLELDGVAMLSPLDSGS